MICPKCELPQENYTPLLPWKGCKRCLFGVMEFMEHLNGSRMNYHDNWVRYREAMKKAFDRLEVEKMIEGVDK